MARFRTRLTETLRSSRWLSPVMLLFAGEAGSRVGLIPAHTPAAPPAMLKTLFDRVVSGELPGNVLVSAMQACLEWEYGLVAQWERDGAHGFLSCDQASWTPGRIYHVC